MGSLATALACLAAAAPGCGGPQALEAPPKPTAFAISFERSGGLKPTTRKLAIRPGGHAVASVRGSDGAYDRPVRFQVGAKRIRSLRRGLARARFSAIESTTTPGSCADCYRYSIRYRGHAVALQETDVPARLRRVIDQLEAMITARAGPSLH